MECNKEEAFRAMQLAEKKMQAHDFSGAQKIGQKAQRLFPDLENISQLLMVCEVHCSAQVKIGGTEMDWYRILQTEQTVDAVTIKKQYRKLALLLHPDKNKFAGAEAAFKLIGEANRVLSDQPNRSGYDMRYRALVKTASSRPSRHQPKGNSFAQKQHSAVNNFQNHPCPQSTGWYWHQQAQSQTFWTCCSSCNTRYQYYRDCVNKTLMCQSCYKSFVALDWGISGPGSFWGQFPHVQETPNQGPPNVASQGINVKSSVERSSNTFGGSQPMSKTGSESKMEETPNQGPPNVASQGCNGKSSVERSSNTFGGSQPMSKTGSESKMEERDNGDVPVPKQGVGMPYHDSVKSKKPDSSKKLIRKRGRKLTVESSESYMTESEDDVREDNVADSSAANEGHPRRRSSRQKQNVSYKYNLSDDDDFVSPPKRSWVSNSSDVSKESTRNSSEKGGIANDDLPAQAEFSSVPLEESSTIKKNRARKSEVKGKEADIFDHPGQKSKTNDDSELKSNEAAVPESFSSPDPEFNDFDKGKAESCFAVNQTWAIYDAVDCMPRFYARIKKVFFPEFKLKITWLEANPDNKVEIDWCDKELPVACGKYVLGDTQMADHNMFSHQMHCIKGSGRNTFVVYPMKGETWALFQNWGINWSTEPQKHQPFKFDFVEVLSDFVEDAGVHVAYLGRLKGFVSVFQQTEQHGIFSFQIPPNEMYRFSHRVPSFRLSGEEREGIPKGSYELDPASLPPSLFESGDDNDAKMDGGSINAGINVSCPKSQKSEAEDASGFEGISASGKHERSSLKKETSLPRKSPRKSNSNGQTGGSQGVAVDSGKNDLSNGNVPLSKRRASVCQADEEGINTPKKQGRNHESEAFKLRRSPRDVSKQKSEANGNRLTNEEVSSRQTHSQKDENSDFCSHTTSSSAAKTSSSVKDPSTKISAKSPAVEPSITPNCNVPQAECFDFTEQRSKEKFKVGQIWALRTDEDAKLLAYALVKRIQSTPELRVHVGLLDPCSPPKDTSHPVCCGIFKFRNKETKVFSLSSFSHCLNAKPMGLNVYEIYPRKGEIWALHKSRNGDLTSPSPNKGKCDIVEVLEDNDQSTTVVLLFRVSGFKSMFKAPRIQRSKTGVLDIPRAEVARFLHQIPAFQHTGESDSRLDGCWELDPSSIPVSIVCLD
ncbi:J domain-containing protein [Morus notabilis]|uniref:J domain-containing protein n=1 Tax=Morus notabilis TaxID=981085 RepID=W9R445_9ROSA|nr:uncharacterized protein LOC21393512 [Morus notabilis]XP_024021977.1 uncharacterized protein LOC21393512 [Morus notabilis]EXB67645.1 J domain-containing protein [Morus notabilis]